MFLFLHLYFLATYLPIQICICIFHRKNDKKINKICKKRYKKKKKKVYKNTQSFKALNEYILLANYMKSSYIVEKIYKLSTFSFFLYFFKYIIVWDGDQFRVENSAPISFKIEIFIFVYSIIELIDLYQCPLMQ